MKILSVLFFFIFLIGVASSSGLSISPSEIDFKTIENQESCKQIMVSTEGEGFLIGEDKWAKKGVIEKKFLVHTLSSEDLNLKIDYPKRFGIKNFTTIDICITPEDSGFYHGLLLYKKENSKAGVGIWINLNVTESEKFSIAKLTGDTIKESDVKKSLIILPIILAIILITLLLKLNKKKYQNLQ